MNLSIMKNMVTLGDHNKYVTLIYISVDYEGFYLLLKWAKMADSLGTCEKYARLFVPSKNNTI
jgi:hypothetical protein